LDVESICRAPGTNAELDLQLEWHCRQDKDVPQKKNVTEKELKIAALVAAVERHNKGIQVNSPTTMGSSVLEVHGTEEAFKSGSDTSELYH
jgi:hypothetical protein